MAERVLYFGDPRGALALLDLGIVPCGVVHGRRGGPGWLTLLPRLGDVPRWTRPDLGDPSIVEALRSTAPDRIAAAFYPRRIPQPVLDLAPGLNVHPSDLPRWRGPDPTHWTVRAGDERTALCVHALTAGIDEGDVFVREPHAVRPRESAGALAERLEARGARLLAETIGRVLAGEAIQAHPQSGTPSWAPLVDPDELEIDWSRPAVEIDRLVRASAPHPGAYTGIGDELLVVLAGRPVAAEQMDGVPTGSPYVTGARVYIRCGDGALRLDRVRLGRRPLSGRALARLLV